VGVVVVISSVDGHESVIKILAKTKRKENGQKSIHRLQAAGIGEDVGVWAAHDPGNHARAAEKRDHCHAARGRGGGSYSPPEGSSAGTHTGVGYPGDASALRSGASNLQRSFHNIV
jgi:hypothetical protein